MSKLLANYAFFAYEGSVLLVGAIHFRIQFVFIFQKLPVEVLNEKIKPINLGKYNFGNRDQSLPLAFFGLFFLSGFRSDKRNCHFSVKIFFSKTFSNEVLPMEQMKPKVLTKKRVQEMRGMG